MYEDLIRLYSVSDVPVPMISLKLCPDFLYSIYSILEKKVLCFCVGVGCYKSHTQLKDLSILHF